MKTKVILGIFMIFFCLLWVNSNVFASMPDFDIKPSKFELLLEPRGKTIESFTVTNNGLAPLTFHASTQDWDVSMDGRLILIEPGTTSYSASNWVRFNPKRFEIQPEDSQVIRFSVNVPPNVLPGEYRTTILLTSEDTFQVNEEISFQPQFAIIVYINIPEIVRESDLQDVKIEFDEGGSYFLNGEVISSGNAHVRLDGLYTVTDQEGKVVLEGDFGKKIVLADHIEPFRIELGNQLPVGYYQVNLDLSYISPIYAEGSLEEYLGIEGLHKVYQFEIE